MLAQDESQFGDLALVRCSQQNAHELEYIIAARINRDLQAEARLKLEPRERALLRASYKEFEILCGPAAATTVNISSNLCTFYT
jgi:hypothetical protein